METILALLITSIGYAQTYYTTLDNYLVERTNDTIKYHQLIGIDETNSDYSRRFIITSDNSEIMEVRFYYNENKVMCSNGRDTTYSTDVVISNKIINRP